MGLSGALLRPRLALTAILVNDFPRSIHRRPGVALHVKQPCVYMLASKRNGTLYIGVTSNIVERVRQHKEGEADGFTARYEARTLVWFESHDSMREAIAREKALKEWKRAWKIRLIEERNPQWRDLSEELY